jgi:hypothetical protein
MGKMAAIQAQLEQATARGTGPVQKQAAPKTPETASAKAPSREGKTHIGAYLHPDFKRSLMLVRAHTGQDVQTLIAQALNDLFRAHNVPVIDHE